jgi:hypothetical protein
MEKILEPVFSCLGFSPAVWFAVALLAGGAPARALVITPTWESSITNDPNAATIEATINTAIQVYEARFSDPITVSIHFQEMSSGLGMSGSQYQPTTYSQFRTNLQNDATTTNDTIALAHLAVGVTNPATGTTSINVNTANLRALGIAASPPYDGDVYLNTSSMNLSRSSIDPSKYDLMAVAEHEMDEVLGFGSSLDFGITVPSPEDLFRYTSTGSRTYTTSGDDAYFSIDGATDLARFNQVNGDDHGDWWWIGPHTPQVQDASTTPGVTPNLGVELIALDVIGYNLLPEPQPRITGIHLSGTNLVLNATNGLANGTYYVLMSTNVAQPLSQWTPLTTNVLSANGNFTITATNAVNPLAAQRFYTLQLQ